MMRMRLPRRRAAQVKLSTLGSSAALFSTARMPQMPRNRSPALDGSVSSPAWPSMMMSRPSNLVWAQLMPACARASVARPRKSASMRPCSACTASQLSTSKGMMPQSQRHQLHLMRARLPRLQRAPYPPPDPDPQPFHDAFPVTGDEHLNGRMLPEDCPMLCCGGTIDNRPRHSKPPRTIRPLRDGKQLWVG